MFNLKRTAIAFMLLAALQGADSTIVAVADQDDTPVAESPSNAASIKRGKLLFLQCRACHEVAAGQSHRIGPTLHGIMGRKAARAEGYAYSDALRESELVWDVATLDRWLMHPASVVPGTTMAFVGIPGEADRRALIAYIESATR